MVIPVGLPEAQQLVVAQKELSGRITVRESCPCGSRCSRERKSLHSERLREISATERWSRHYLVTSDPHTCNEMLAPQVIVFA
jgi:hypothetical protein